MTGHADADETVVGNHPPTNDRAEQRVADRRRAAKLRERREQAGQVRIQAWVPRERADHARQVLRAAAAGANTLPPDPGQQADLDAAKAETAAIRAELEEARATEDCQTQKARLAEEVALTRVKLAEQGREEAARELVAVRAEVEAAQGRERDVQETAAALRGELERIRGRGGWRGMLLRLAGAGPQRGLPQAGQFSGSG